ncbi:hypothetical protein E4630_16100 [Aeromonas hydrophila]|nr:hypothetical protein E4625_16320 [Aeromonas hydrophila]QBX78532.1 hypothetical protein E4630_16100 [Aeromonas hydrophila]
MATFRLSHLSGRRPVKSTDPALKEPSSQEQPRAHITPQATGLPSSPEMHDHKMGEAPAFPPPHPFETYLFERLKTYAQGYLPLPWPHCLMLMDESVRAELDRQQSEKLAEMDREQAARELARLTALERKRISSTRYVMKCWATTVLTRLRLKISAPFSRS